MTACTETHHVLATIDDTSCQCGAVLVTARGFVLAADPASILQPCAMPLEPRTVGEQSWIFKVQP